MPTLAPFQRRAVDWFVRLGPSSGMLVAPPGSGKTRIASAVIPELDPKGPVLVVAPASTQGQWIDAIEAWGIDAERIAPRSLSALLASRERDDLGLGVKAWVVSGDLAGMDSVASVLTSIRWRLVIVDEAQGFRSQTRRGEFVERIEESAEGVLFLTATPTQVVQALPIFRIDADQLQGVAHGPSLRLQVDDVEPTNDELRYLDAVSSWSDAKSTLLPSSMRSLIARYTASGLMQGIEALEHLLSGVPPDVAQEAIGTDWRLNEQSRGEVRQLLDLAYRIELPDSRTRRLVELAKQAAERRCIVIGAFSAGLTYLGSLLASADVPSHVLSAAMDEDERRSVAHLSRGDSTVLLMSDAVAGPSLMLERDILVHADLPLRDDFRRRVGLFVEGREVRRGESLDTTVVRWRSGYIKSWIDAEPRDLPIDSLAN